MNHPVLDPLMLERVLKLQEYAAVTHDVLACF